MYPVASFWQEGRAKLLEVELRKDGSMQNVSLLAPGKCKKVRSTPSFLWVQLCMFYSWYHGFLAHLALP